MAALIYFLAFLSVSAACYAVCRLVGYRPKFKSVANVVAHVFCFTPIVAMSFVLISGVGAVVLALLALLLHTTGDLPAVMAWGVWHLLPEWAWFAIAAAASIAHSWSTGGERSLQNGLPTSNAKARTNGHGIRGPSHVPNPSIERPRGSLPVPATCRFSVLSMPFPRPQLDEKWTAARSSPN